MVFSAVEFELIRYQNRAKKASENGSPANKSKRGRSESEASDSEDDVPLSKRSKLDESPSRSSPS